MLFHTKICMFDKSTRNKYTKHLFRNLFFDWNRIFVSRLFSLCLFCYGFQKRLRNYTIDFYLYNPILPNKGIPSNEKNNMTKLHIENQITEFPNKVSTQKITSNDIFDKLKDNILRSRRKYSSANDSNHLEPYENNILLDISNIS